MIEKRPIAWDRNGKPVAVVFPSRRRVSKRWFFQVVGANSEPQSTSEPYVSEANAVRGFEDLEFRVGETSSTPPAPVAP